MGDSDVRDVLNDIGRALGIYDDDDQEQEPCEIENVFEEIARLKDDNAAHLESIAEAVKTLGVASRALVDVTKQNQERGKEIERLQAEIITLRADAAKDAEMIDRLAQLAVDVYSGETSKTPAYAELARMGVHKVNSTWERVK